MYPFDKLMPGVQRKDMDGDGVIRTMRIKTPYGAWKKSEVDPRIMKRRQPDDLVGEFYNLFDEGYIEGDFDGVNITPAAAPFGNDFNRNYPVGWQPEDVQRGSGDYPLSNPETRANSDFLLAHPNICAIIDMHTSGGQNLYTPGFKSAKEAHKQDIDLYKAIGKVAKEENGYHILNLYDQYMPASHPQTCGGFDDFCHFVLGVPAMTIECWDLAERSGLNPTYPPREDKSDEELEFELCAKLKWIDENVGVDTYKNWTEFEHPQLGTVEIGGCEDKYLSQNPPPPYLEQEVKKHTKFMLRLSKMLPTLTIDNVTVNDTGDGVFKIEAVCGNLGYMPTYVFKEGLKSARLKGVSVTLDGAEVLGEATQELGHLEGHSGYNVSSWGLAQGTNQRAPLCKKVTWFIKGKKGDEITLIVKSGKAGTKNLKVVI